MTRNAATSTPETRADAGESATPPRRRNRPFDSLERVRREMSTIYWAAKHGDMDVDRAKALTYLLSQVSATLRRETSDEGELGELLALVRERVKR